MKNVLIKYVRDRKKNPIGVVAAYVHEGDIHYGWSLLNKKAGDSWNREYGLNLAISRGETLDNIALDALGHKIPQTVAKDLTSMVYRAKSYFHQV